MTQQSKVTIREVANHAGVSISSVSRVLSGHPNVSASLRQRVETSVRTLNYQPDFLAYSLRRGTTSSIGFLVGTISNPIMADISARASEVLSARGYAMLLVCSQNDPDADVSYLQFLARRQVSGLIVSSAADGPDRAAALIAELGVPTVMLDRDISRLHHVSAVQSEHRSGMQAAVQHLIAQGHERIGLIGGPDYLFPARERLVGYRAAYAATGLRTDPRLLCSVGFHASRAHMATLHLLAQPDPPTALIAAGNTILVGVLQALQEKELTMGTDLALIGCDDTALTRLFRPPITVIARDLALLGETAAQLLLDIITTGRGQSVQLPTQLIVRASSQLEV